MKCESECFIFICVFHKNIHEIPAKYKIQKVYTWPYTVIFAPHNFIVNSAYYATQFATMLHYSATYISVPTFTV